MDSKELDRILRASRKRMTFTRQIERLERDVERLGYEADTAGKLDPVSEGCLEAARYALRGAAIAQNMREARVIDRRHSNKTKGQK